MPDTPSDTTTLIEKAMFNALLAEREQLRKQRNEAWSERDAIARVLENQRALCEAHRLHAVALEQLYGKLLNQLNCALRDISELRDSAPTQEVATPEAGTFPGADIPAGDDDHGVTEAAVQLAEVALPKTKAPVSPLTIMQALRCYGRNQAYGRDQGAREVSSSLGIDRDTAHVLCEWSSPHLEAIELLEVDQEDEYRAALLTELKKLYEAQP